MCNDSFVKCEMVDGIAVLTISNPPMNPLCAPLMDELDRCFNLFEHCEDLRVVIITGAGKAFVAGADIREFLDWEGETLHQMMIKGQSLFSRIEHCKAPVIAAINGYALGGGLELALSCDIRIASEKVKLGFPEVTLGIIPGYGGTQRLIRTVSPGQAKKLIYSADMITAEESRGMGLVQEVVAPDELMPRCLALARRIAANAPIAVRAAKQTINYEIGQSLPSGLLVERKAFCELFKTSDKKEGVAAFLEKRKAVFKNH